MKTKQYYNFGIKENKKLGFQAVVLADKTHIVIGKSSISILFPKTKFSRLFLEQINDKTKKYISISFSEIELRAIMRGIEMLSKKRRK